MLTYNYLNQLRSDVARWQKAGVINSTQSDSLLDDALSQREGRSFGTVVALLGAALITFGIIAFVASNWEAMGDMFRFGTVIAFLLLAYAIAGFFYYKNFHALTHAFLAIAIAAFGGGIMLVGQIFHLQGNTADALFLWLAGAVITVLATRSYAAVVAMVAILVVWIGYEFWGDSRHLTFLGIQRTFWFPLVWLVAAGLAWWVSSRLAAHLLGLAMVYWLFMMAQAGNFSTIWVICIAYVITALALASYTTKMVLKGFEVPLISYCFIVLLGLSPVLQIFAFTSKSRITDSTLLNYYVPLGITLAITLALVVVVRSKGNKIIRDQYVIPIALLLPLAANLLSRYSPQTLLPVLGAAVGLFMAIWTVRFGWRIESRSLSTLGYLFFIYFLFDTYNRLFGSLQMTAVAYAIAGLGLMGLSIWLIKGERKTKISKVSDA